MTDEDKRELARALATQIEDVAWDVSTPKERATTAALLVESIEFLLHQQGWTPPAVTLRQHDQLAGWRQRLGQIPDHHLTRDVLNSHLAELAQIMKPG